MQTSLTTSTNSTIFRTAKDSDTNSLKRIWASSFGADNEFMSLFFGHFKTFSRQFILEKDGNTVSSLYTIPVSYMGHSGCYVYGVCTDPDFRGHRYAMELLSNTEELYFKNGSDFMILRPASPTLFEYYRKQGYITEIFRSDILIHLPDSTTARTSVREILPEDLYTHRCARLNTKEFTWTRAICDYHIQYIKYCMGKSYETSDGKYYFLAYPDPENDKIIICEESNIDASDHLLPHLVKQEFPNASEMYVHLSDKNSPAYLLCKTKSRFIKIESATLFNFTME